MRSILPFLLLSACSTLDPLTESPFKDDEVGCDTAVVTDTADDDEDTAVSDTAAECGFVVNDGLVQDDTETHSLAVFSSPMGGTDVEMHAGETVHYGFTVSALDCGDINLNLANFRAYDLEDGQWLQDERDAEELMGLTNFSDGVVYDPTATPVNNTGIGLNYAWYDGVTGYVVNGAYDNMETVSIAAGTEKTFEFTFTTERVPAGTTVTLGLHSPIWTDMASGVTVWDTMGGQGTEVNITIVE